MSFYFREKPRFGDKLKGKSGDELLQEFKQHFDTDKTFFEPKPRQTRDPFDRHTAFSRGFPFDDEGFGRRTDIRSHLDDLAARHPEFADHLLGPAWGDIPFHGSLRNRRRGSGSGSSHQGHQDEDARSQASGSSATSAASGASGVSSHGEPDQSYQPQETSNKLPQYGLRNTVDIGQHRHDMQNPEKANRGQRSMSAPPENRQGQEEVQQSNQGQQNQPQPSQNQRFVSRVDITPQFNPQTGEKMSPKPQQSQPQQQQQQQQQSQKQQSNVRHIPIFVEGRDRPVIPKNVEEPEFRLPQSPPRYHQSQFDDPPEFHSPPQFHRPSHFNQHFAGKHSAWPGFPEDFVDSFDTFDHPGVRRTHQETHPSPFRQQQQNQFPPTTTTTREQSQPKHPFNHHQSFNQQTPFTQQNSFNQQQPFNQQQQQQPHQEAAPEPPKPKQITPKGPLEKVALVQQEVDSLTEQVKLWNGDSRKDKQYMFLDEMLTRELIKLDDIETEGKENVRQARKNAIKSIQDSISLLESLAPLPGQAKKEVEQPMEAQPNEVGKVQDNVVHMETEKKSDDRVKGEAIPLPPGPTTSPIPNSPLKESPETVQNQVPADVEPSALQENQGGAIPMEAAPIPETSVPAATEIPSAPSMDKLTTPVADAAKDGKKSPKKVKKTKKQTPVSTEPIPLPAPQACQTDVK